MSNNFTHVLVRFKENNPDKETTIIPIDQLKSHKNGKLNPKHAKDFVDGFYYAVKKEPTDIWAHARLCAFGTKATLEQLRMKRVSVKKMNTSNVNESLTDIIDPNQKIQLSSDEESALEKKKTTKRKKNLQKKLEQSIIKEKRLANMSTFYDEEDNENGDIFNSAVSNKSKVVEPRNKHIPKRSIQLQLPTTKRANNSNLDQCSRAITYESSENNSGNDLGKNAFHVDRTSNQSLYSSRPTSPSLNSNSPPMSSSLNANNGDNHFNFEENFVNSVQELQNSTTNIRPDGMVWKKKITKNDKTREVEMVHLGRGVSIPVKNWNIVKTTSTTRSLFVKNLARAMYGREKLANRCLKESQKNIKVTTRASPRKILTPKKVNVIKDCWRLFLTNIKPSLLQGQDLEVVLSKVTTPLSDEISYEVKRYKLGNVNDKTPLCIEEPYEDELSDSFLEED